MRRIIFLSGIILVLVCSMFILTGCGASKDETIPDKNDVYSKDGSVKDAEIKEYTYKDLSFKLTDDYEATSNASEDTTMYNTKLEDDVMKMFAVGSFEAEGIDYVEKASEGLKDQDFNIKGYEVSSRKDPEIVEYNGIKAISVFINYNNSSINSNAEIEYCYAQKGNTVYAICFEYFTQNGKEIKDSDFSKAFDSVKETLQLAE